MVGATIRLYLEKYEAPTGDLTKNPLEVLRVLLYIYIYIYIYIYEAPTGDLTK